jgi:AraC-like DNA-binding protein
MMSCCSIKGESNLGNSNNKGIVNFTRTPALPGVELLTARGSTHHWRVYHERYAVCANDAVAAEIRYRKISHAICDHSTLLFEPGETHDTHRVAKPQDFNVLFLTPEIMQQYGEEMGLTGQTHFKPAPNIDEQVYSLGKRLHSAMIENESAIEQQSLLAGFIGVLMNCHAEQKVNTNADTCRLPLLRARDYLRDRFAHAVTLDEIAKVAGLSRFHFLKAFSAEFGLPPHTYQIQLRIERSLPLLRKGMCLTHVAETIGFNDQSHFIRHFKRVMGVTPGQYKGRTWSYPLRVKLM